jgi:hypothetical protein
MAARSAVVYFFANRRCDVPLSTHYYVLALSAETVRLYEAFREYLIEIRSQSFPFETRDRPLRSFGQDQALELARTVDTCFGHYYACDPLRVVVIGETGLQSAFTAVTAHGDAVVGRVDGDHSTTSARDLGQIVWPIVKAAISGVLDRALADLEVCARRGRISCGLESVARRTGAGAPTTLLVEEGYRIRGSIVGTGRSPFFTPEVDVRETLDDAVDAVIEQVLASGGNVVFTPDGALEDRRRIVLLRRGDIAEDQGA